MKIEMGESLCYSVLVSTDFPHSRYYTTQYEVNGKNYRITNDWYERSRSYLLKWRKEQEESESPL